LSPGQSSANLMIAGVQELHGSTFDATAMQTDPSEGRNQLRSDKVSAYQNSTLDQRYLSENPTNRYQIAQESLQDPSATGGHGGDIEFDEFEGDDIAVSRAESRFAQTASAKHYGHSQGFET
jgi:hypothetical protein